jgi:hypothetical protein
MIKKYFKTRSLESISLKECSLYLNIKRVPIEDVYIFPDSPFHEYTILGSEWKRYKKIYSHHKGYFSSVTNSDYLWEHIRNYKSEEIAIIGYEGAYRYQLLGVSVGRRKQVKGFLSYYVASFSFQELKKQKMS